MNSEGRKYYQPPDGGSTTYTRPLPTKIDAAEAKAAAAKKAAEKAAEKAAAKEAAAGKAAAKAAAEKETRSVSAANGRIDGSRKGKAEAEAAAAKKSKIAECEKNIYGLPCDADGNIAKLF